MTDPHVASDAVNIAIAIFEFAGGYALSCIAGAGGGVLIAKTYLTEKIKAAIKGEYDEKLVILKSDLKSANDRELEKLKSELKSQGDLAIEKFKSDLAVAAAQQNVEFSHLHLNRAEVIAQVYAELRDAIDAMAEYTKAFEPVNGASRKERGSAAANATNKFMRTFRTQEIYLPEASAEKVQAIAEKLKFTFFQFLYGFDFGEDLGAHRTKKLLEIQGEVEKLSGPALNELKKDFRGLLGYRSKISDP